MLLLAGCKPSHRVNFKPPNVSIDLGDGWKQINIPVDLPACSPCLISKAGMINAVFLEQFTDVNQAADFLQARFSTGHFAVPDSFKRENFTTDSGLNGVHLSYSATSAKGTAPDERSHSFITQNMVGKCVSVSYITSPSAESAAVIEAIRKTLRVE
jgi:hypothetical protein